MPSKRKKYFCSRVLSCISIKYRCVCIQSFSVYLSINTTDATPVGLGGMFTQSGTVISYASKALSSVERHYSQIKYEPLAIAWGCYHFRMYLL